MTIEYTPPDNIALRPEGLKTVFLAGSIEMGVAENWQPDLANFFNNIGIGVFNPRRADWDSSWKQEYTNPNFYQQVRWELNALDKADAIIMYFDPNTKSPISLLELGLYASSGKVSVVCPEGFWKKGNVDVVCDVYNIPLYHSISELKKHFLDKFTKHNKQ